MSRISLITVAVMLGAGCTYQGTPVPVVGDTQLLEGEWDGTYSSEQVGRSGSIQFQLKAGTDSAYGDVLMIPARMEEVQLPTVAFVPGQFRKTPHLLKISFVRCEGGDVTGRIDPYVDPDTGEQIYTTFEGRLRGKEFQGTFSTYYPGSSRALTGKWLVTRRK